MYEGPFPSILHIFPQIQVKFQEPYGPRLTNANANANATLSSFVPGCIEIRLADISQ